jgi:hypothetical protein
MSAQTVNSEESEWDGARFGREESTGVVFGLDFLQVLFLGIGMVIAVAFVIAGGFPGGTLAAVGTVVVFGGLGIPRVFGKSFLKWVQVFMTSWSRKRTGQNEYMPEEDGVDVAIGDEGVELLPELEVMDPPKRSEDTTRDKKGRIVPLKPARLMLPGEFGELLVYQMPGGAAFAYDPTAKEAVVVAQISTHKAFGLESFDNQEARLRAWAEVEATISGMDGVVRVQMSDQTTMVSGQAVLDYYESRVNESDYRVDPVTGEHLRNAGQELNPWLHQGLVEMLASVEGRPVHTRWLSVVLNRDQLTKRIQGAGRGIRGFMEVALSVMNTVAEALPESGTEVARWHTPTSAAALIRTAFDPASSVEVTARGEDGSRSGCGRAHVGQRLTGNVRSPMGQCTGRSRSRSSLDRKRKLGFLSDIHLRR